MFAIGCCLCFFFDLWFYLLLSNELFYLVLAIVDFILRELVAQNCLLFWCLLFSDDAVVRLCLDLYRVFGFGTALVRSSIRI